MTLFLTLIAFGYSSSVFADGDADVGFANTSLESAFRRWQSDHPGSDAADFYRDSGKAELEKHAKELLAKSKKPKKLPFSYLAKNGPPKREPSELSTEYVQRMSDMFLDRLRLEWLGKHPEDENDGHLNQKLKVNPRNAKDVSELLLAIRTAQKVLEEFPNDQFVSANAVKLQVYISMLQAIARRSGLEVSLFENLALEARIRKAAQNNTNRAGPPRGNHFNQ